MSNTTTDAMKAKLAGLEVAVKEILFQDWDPIGLNDHPGAPTDEYGAYAPEVIALAMEASGPVPIAYWLEEVAQERMALKTSWDQNVKAAKRIFQAVHIDNSLMA